MHAFAKNIAEESRDETPGEWTQTKARCGRGRGTWGEKNRSKQESLTSVRKAKECECEKKMKEINITKKACAKAQDIIKQTALTTQPQAFAQ